MWSTSAFRGLWLLVLFWKVFICTRQEKIPNLLKKMRALTCFHVLNKTNSLLTNLDFDSQWVDSLKTTSFTTSSKCRDKVDRGNSQSWKSDHCYAHVKVYEFINLLAEVENSLRRQESMIKKSEQLSYSRWTLNWTRCESSFVAWR